MPERKKVAAKPVKTSKTGTSVQENEGDNVSEPLAQTDKKNNLIPTIIVLSIVIGCVAIVSISKKIA